jgi:hypothetical protein
VDEALREFMAVIAGGDVATALVLLAASPALAKAVLARAATRETAEAHFLTAISHHVYAGDTALHVAAVACQPEIVGALLAAGADVGVRNRRGATPLHYAADGNPASARWAPERQADVIRLLIQKGADPNALDKSGVAPLHRGIRNRCAAAVAALLAGGADARLKNRNGSSPFDLATKTTGKGGSGSPEAKAQQAEIVRILEG